MKKGMKKGFTLVELIIVVAIIGILVAIAVPRYAEATKGAEQRRMQSEAKTIVSAAQTYYAKNTKHATTWASLDAFLPEKLKSTVSVKTYEVAISNGEVTVSNTEYVTKGGAASNLIIRGNEVQ